MAVVVRHLADVVDGDAKITRTRPWPENWGIWMQMKGPSIDATQALKRKAVRMLTSMICTSADFTKWLEVEEIPASDKLVLFEAARTYLVVDHNTAHRAHVFDIATPTCFVCACCYR